jgi:hypothetical protein
MTTSRRPAVRALLRILAVVPVVASITVIGSAAKVGPSVAGCAEAASVHHAALVVEHGGGGVVTVCVAFSEDSITGGQLLARSGVEYATAYSGQAVCQIDHEPPDGQVPPGCWTTSSPYWAMFVSRGGGSWSMSSLGFTSQTFRDGDAEGFRYEGQSDYTAPPSPHGVCPVATPPTPLPTKAATPERSAVATAVARPSSSAPPSRTAVAGTATPSPSATVSEPTAAPSSSAMVGTIVSRPGTGPTAQPPLMSTGAWAASALGTALVVLLVVQVTRPRRRQPPPPGQP